MRCTMEAYDIILLLMLLGLGDPFEIHSIQHYALTDFELFSFQIMKG